MARAPSWLVGGLIALGACTGARTGTAPLTQLRPAANALCDGGDCEAAAPVACDPLRQLTCPIDALGWVVQVEWQGPSDVDLSLTGPDGLALNAAQPEGHGGVFVGDARSACAGEQVGRERIVWRAAPPAGRYTARAELFDSCGAPPVTVRFTVLEHGRVLHHAEHVLTQGREEHAELVVTAERAP